MALSKASASAVALAMVLASPAAEGIRLRLLLYVKTSREWKVSAFHFQKLLLTG